MSIDPAPFDPQDPQTKLRNMVLDFFYGLYRRGKTNAEILKRLQSTDMPPVTEAELNLLRLKFKTLEERQPAKMAEFRRRLKIP